MKKLKDLAKEIGEMEIPVYAANASFFILLSIFPGMMLIIGLLQYTPLEPDYLLSALSGVMPSVLEPLLDYMIGELFVKNSVVLLSVSAVAAVWSASRGVYSLFSGLNRVYHVKETRNYFLIRLQCVGYTVLLMVALILTLVLHLAGKQLFALIFGPGKSLPSALQFLVVASLLSGLFLMMFIAFPNRRLHVREVWPGAVGAAIGWLVFSALFSFYVTRFSNYSLYYGSLAIVALTMLWLFICICILFYGGLLNYLLARFGKR